MSPAPAAIGRYTLVARIATGGMGEVWRAHDEVLQRDVALKLLKAEYADAADFRERFLTEARNAGSLQHPNIVQVLDFGETEDEQTRPFIAMELVEGQPLSTLLRSDEAMPHEVAVDLIAQAADALGVAHAAGIVHRDVKPGNLLITPDRRVKVTDFGISRATDAVPLTRTGELIGTPHYLSPEQVDGKTATSASDVYALGVILYEALTGRRPFTGDTPLTAALAHVNQPVPALPGDVLPRWADVVRQALAKDPAERFPDGAALARALRDENHVVAAAPLEATQLITRPASRRRLPWWVPAALLGLVALLVIGIVALTRDDTVKPTSQDPSASPTPTVRLVKSEYVGRDAEAVARELRRAGLRARIREVANPERRRAGTVADLGPVGRVDEGTLITISAFTAPAPQAPAPAPQEKQPKTTEKKPPKTKSNGSGPGQNSGKNAGKGKGNR